MTPPAGSHGSRVSFENMPWPDFNASALYKADTDTALYKGVTNNQCISLGQQQDENVTKSQLNFFKIFFLYLTKAILTKPLEV